MQHLSKYRIILGSKSPRRKQLLEGLDVSFEILTQDAEENYPDNLKKEEIPLFLAEMKSKAFEKIIKNNELVITADTIVWLTDKTLEKPSDYNDAFRILKTLSGKQHQVYTGVYIKTINNTISFYDCTNVFFKDLSDFEIKYYLDNYKPYDKAGAYGVQEWIGYVAVEKIEGCFFNVMGLPLPKLYNNLLKF